MLGEGPGKWGPVLRRATSYTPRIPRRSDAEDRCRVRSWIGDLFGDSRSGVGGGAGGPAAVFAVEGLRREAILLEQSGSQFERRQQEADPGRDDHAGGSGGAGHR